MLIGSVLYHYPVQWLAGNFVMALKDTRSVRHANWVNPQGRPIPIVVEGGRPIPELA
jgi:hypothetical protein